jgi:hypothetical protein
MSDELRERRIARLASQQHGVVASTQLKDAGVARSTISDWTAAGRLHRLHRGVYAVRCTSPCRAAAGAGAPAASGSTPRRCFCALA